MAILRVLGWFLDSLADQYSGDVLSAFFVGREAQNPVDDVKHKNHGNW